MQVQRKVLAPAVPLRSAQQTSRAKLAHQITVLRQERKNCKVKTSHHFVCACVCVSLRK